MQNLIFIFVVSFLSVSQASTFGFYKIHGLKYPNSNTEGDSPVVTHAVAPASLEELKGYTELLPYVTPSPDQEEAGSCLYMSLTGIAEWWMRKLDNRTQFTPDDDLDLSERWWVSLSDHADVNKKVKDWVTDSIYLFNAHYSVLNKDYRFTKNWYQEPEDFDVYPAKPNEPGAVLGTKYNWIDESQSVKVSKPIHTPTFHRTIILKGSDEDPWAIGTAPKNIAEKVKAALVENKAPVHVIYNHGGYWHAVFILGYDDDASIGDCPLIQESFQTYREEEQTALANAEKAPTESEKNEALARAKKYVNFARALNKSLKRTNGCTKKGVFYVRDSEYSDPSEPIYKYDLASPALDKPYSKRIILREYDWLVHLANNILIITAD